jgi:hypothetical protein
MAAVSKSLAENGRRSSSSSGRANLSHGRGGAGTFPPSFSPHFSPLYILSIPLSSPYPRNQITQNFRATKTDSRNKGNIGTTPSDFEAPTLETPTLKSDVYTTGRGGSGNMAKNNDPEAARRAQDVVAYVPFSLLDFPKYVPNISQTLHSTIYVINYRSMLTYRNTATHAHSPTKQNTSGAAAPLTCSSPRISMRNTTKETGRTRSTTVIARIMGRRGRSIGRRRMMRGDWRIGGRNGLGRLLVGRNRQILGDGEEEGVWGKGGKEGTGGGNGRG